MALTRADTRDPAMRLVVFSVAAGLPLACYLATASAHGYWLDAGEFVAASIDLGISHPPGHPLTALVNHALTLLPFGPLALRVALASAICAAAAAGFLFRAVETTVRSLGVQRSSVAVPLALGATWLVAGSYGWWFQAVRPEVYALQALLICAAIERLIHLESMWPTHDLRPLYAACFAVGLALANHHFLAFLLLPAMAPTFARVHRARGFRPLLLGFAFIAVGLAPYLYLPIRAETDPPVNLGDPSSVERFYWVVSAKVFQKSPTELVTDPFWVRLLDVAEQFVVTLHWIPLLLAILGAYVLLRVPGARRIGTIWITVFVVFFAARAWLGFVSDNPDALGYLMPALGAVGALAAAFVAGVLTLVGGADRERPRRIAIAIAFVVGVLGLAQVHRNAAQSSLARFSATDSFSEIDYRDLEPRAVVVLYEPQTVFRYWGIEASEGVRPDVTIVPMPFLRYPGVANALDERHPELRELTRAALVDDRLRVPELQDLAAERPVYLEMDVRVPLEVLATVVPAGPYLEVTTDAAYAEDLRPGRLSEEKAWQRLERLLRGERDHETDLQILWRSYGMALYYAHVGDRDAARIAAVRGLQISRERELERLLEALGPPGGEGEDEPIDILPFLPHGPASGLSPMDGG
jgi:hypothetical protein